MCDSMESQLIFQVVDLLEKEVSRNKIFVFL